MTVILWRSRRDSYGLTPYARTPPAKNPSRRDARIFGASWVEPRDLVANPTPPKAKHTFTVCFALKTDPNFDTNAPPFDVRGCKVILGGAFLSQGGANWV